MSKGFTFTKVETLPNVLNRRGCEEYTKKGGDYMEELIKELDELQNELRGADMSIPENVQKYNRMQELIKEIYK